MDYATEVSGEGDDDDDDPYSFEPTPGYDFSTPNLARRLSSLKKKKSYDDNFVRPEEYKQPDEGAVLDYEEVPEFIRQQIDMMGLGDNAQIQFVNGTYKISLASPSFNAFPLNRKCTSRMVKEARSKKMAEFEDYDSLDDSDDEPSDYVKKGVSTETSIVNGKTTKKVTTTYEFADGSTKTYSETTTY